MASSKNVGARRCVLSMIWSTRTRSRGRYSSRREPTAPLVRRCVTPSFFSAKIAKSRKMRVVVLGGGFGGVYTAKHLTESLGSREDVEVELLSDKNYFVFQPLLPEVAAGGIAPTHVVNPIREIVPRARFRCCRVRWVDVANKRVYVSQGEGLELVAIPYDHVVFALGKVSSFASMPGVEEHRLRDEGPRRRLPPAQPRDPSARARGRGGGPRAPPRVADLRGRWRRAVGGRRERQRHPCRQSAKHSEWMRRRSERSCACAWSNRARPRKATRPVSTSDPHVDRRRQYAGRRFACATAMTSTFSSTMT